MGSRHRHCCRRKRLRGVCVVQAKPASFVDAIVKNRRVIAIAVALADVAFLWAAIKGVKFFWDQHSE
jgi:hypothetical protein